MWMYWMRTGNASRISYFGMVTISLIRIISDILLTPFVILIMWIWLNICRCIKLMRMIRQEHIDSIGSIRLILLRIMMFCSPRQWAVWTSMIRFIIRDIRFTIRINSICVLKFLRITFGLLPVICTMSAMCSRPIPVLDVYRHWNIRISVLLRLK